MRAEETGAQRKKELPKAAQLVPRVSDVSAQVPAPPTFCRSWGRTLTQAERGTCQGGQEGLGERREEDHGKGDTALRRWASELPRAKE